jgi:hypothetical protein
MWVKSHDIEIVEKHRKLPESGAGMPEKAMLAADGVLFGMFMPKEVLFTSQCPILFSPLELPA